MMNILIKQGSVLHIQVNTTLELLTDVMYNQRYKFNQPDKIPVINGITTSRNRSQKIQSRIKKNSSDKWHNHKQEQISENSVKN